LKVKLTSFDRTCLLLSAVLTAAIFVWLCQIWPHLPEKVAMSFNSAGHPVKQDSRAMLFMLPSINLLILAVFLFGTRLIGTGGKGWNWFVPVTDKNREREIRAALSMMSLVILEITLMIAFVQAAILLPFAGGPNIYRPWTGFVAIVPVFLTILWHWSAAVERNADGRQG